MNRLWMGLIGIVMAKPLLAAGESACPDCVDSAALQIEAAYTGEMWQYVSGGTRDSYYLDDFALTAEADGGRLWGLEGLQLFGQLLYNNGSALGGDLGGTIQGISNIETVEALRLYELWSQWQFGSTGSSVRFGLYDVNSEFDVIEAASLLINPSHGIGPDFAQSGRNGPSIFPVTSLGLRLMKAIGPWTFQAAILDGVPGDPERPDRTTIQLSSAEGALWVGEVNYRAESGLRVAGGYWRYTADFDELTSVTDMDEPRQRNDNAGAYALVESPRLFNRAEQQGLHLYLRVGQAQRRINPLSHYVGIGAIYHGLLTGDRDQLGIALAAATAGDPYRRVLAKDGISTTHREYNYELTYRFTVTEWLTLQSDVQYIRHPGMDPALDPGWICAVRFEISRGWQR